MEYSYCVVKSTYTVGEKKYTTYGIARISEEDGAIIPLETYSDLCADRAKALQLAALCNELKLDKKHLPDVIDDFIA